MDKNRYISKEEKKIPISDPTGKWSDLTLLPEWGEKYYDVYTIKKHGKWVMLKALKKEYADSPEYRKIADIRELRFLPVSGNFRAMPPRFSAMREQSRSACGTGVFSCLRRDNGISGGLPDKIRSC